MAVKDDPEFHRKEGIFATQSVATAAVERDVALSALAEQIRARPDTEFGVRGSGPGICFLARRD